MRLFKKSNSGQRKDDHSRTAVDTRYLLLENPPVPVSEFLFREVEQDECKLYAFIDSARNDEVFSYLLTDNVTYKSLLEGTPDVQSYGISGFMVECIMESPLFQWMTTKAWGDSCLIFFTSKATFNELFEHFQQFNRVYLEDDEEVFFRYYDPRVLRVYLPTCTRDEIDLFFGEVINFFTENQDPEILSAYQRSIKQDEYALLISNVRVDIT